MAPGAPRSSPTRSDLHADCWEEHAHHSMSIVSTAFLHTANKKYSSINLVSWLQPSPMKKQSMVDSTNSFRPVIPNLFRPAGHINFRHSYHEPLHRKHTKKKK